jgi:hypothetical protein
LLSKGYIADFHTVWQESGIECVRRLAKKSPEAFIALTGRLVPNDVHVAIDQTYGGLTPDDSIKESLPAANSESPPAVLEFVRDVVREKLAKLVIEATSELTDRWSESSSN